MKPDDLARLCGWPAPTEYLEFSLDAEPHISHKPGMRCHTIGRHPMRECTAVRYERGPFPDCHCSGHFSRIAPYGDIAGDPL